MKKQFRHGLRLVGVGIGLGLVAWLILVAPKAILCFIMPERTATVQARAATQPVLLTPLKFVGADLAGPVTPAEAAQWMLKKVRTDPPEAHTFLSTNSDVTGLITTETVAAYVEALQQGAEPPDNFCMGIYGCFMRTAAPLYYLKHAKPASRALPADMGLDNLSVSFLTWCGSDEKQRLDQDVKKGLTLRDYMENETIHSVRRPSQFELRFVTGESVFAKEYLIQWMARGADLDQDGREDLLIFVDVHSVEGTGRDFDVYLASTPPRRPQNLKVVRFKFANH